MDAQPLYNSQQPRRTGFSDKPVAALSIAIIVFGCLSIIMGVMGLVVALKSTCTFRRDDYNRYNGDYEYNYWNRRQQTTVPPTTRSPYVERSCSYYHTYMSPGIWAGMMFIASGIIGVLSSQRKITCFIVSMMAMSVVTAWIAVVSIVTAIFANFDTWNEVNPLPVLLHVASSLVAFCSLVAFILSWINFGFACRAVCCNGSKGYPKIKDRFQYQPLQQHPMMYATAPAPMRSQDPVPVVQPQPVVQPAVTDDTIYLVQGHRVIGVYPSQQQSAVNVASQQQSAVNVASQQQSAVNVTAPVSGFSAAPSAQA